MSRPLHALIVSVVVRDQDQRVLLIRHPHRGWELPQGHVEHGEDLLTAAEREVFEETGYQVAVVRLLGIYSKIEPLPSALICGFEARVLAGEATTSSESLEVGWFDEAVALEMPEHPVNRDRLQRLLAAREGIDYCSYRMFPFVTTEGVEF